MASGAIENEYQHVYGALEEMLELKKHRQLMWKNDELQMK